jgi:hypothetical protein
MNKEISQTVVDQRVRNRIIEYFELVSDKNKLLEYQNNVDFVNVLSELVNQWEDWFSIDGYKNGWYDIPIYTKEERKALLSYHCLWSTVVHEMPNNIQTINHFLCSDWWLKIQKKAKSCLIIFMDRGFLDEDRECHSGEE